jgi:hypothetical protein
MDRCDEGVMKSGDEKWCSVGLGLRLLRLQCRPVGEEEEKRKKKREVKKSEKLA